jgi:xanthine dehydrogenase accessory factor
MDTILIRGSGDIGSAVAQRLFLAGYPLALHDSPLPSTTRRKMAFCDAIFDGSALLEGVEARRLDDLSLLPAALAARAYIPVLVCEFELLIKTLQPRVLIDARMRKHSQPENQLHLAPLTIGLGPNFTAAENVHLAIETGRGPDLGRVITRGSASALQGEPAEMAGHARDRYVYTPAAGLFRTSCQIGESVSQGQIIAHLDETPLPAPLTGVLRGLTHDGVPVSARTKIIEVDPRGAQAQVSGIPERPARIARGVLEALQLA